MEIHNPLLFLFMCLIMSDPSKQGCEDYFNVDEWKSILKSDMINLVNATNFKGKVVCTLKNINMTLYNMVLEDCFEKDWDINCVPMLPNSNVIIHKYHFMCMVYKLYRQFNPVTGNNTDAVFGFCSYESLCKVFAETTNSDKAYPAPGKQQLPDQQHDILKILLVSVTVLAVVLPLFVYLYMRQQMKRQVSRGSVIAMDHIDADSSLLSS
ncbi:hypothetical protein PAMA_008929 [Pampus argenteus]